MNEKAGKRRDWVKNAAIVFLTIMLILTFFSNTIMNYSLPEVAIQYIQAGTITSKVRGTGTVQSSSLYNVKVTESRKVTSVAVKVGDTVAEGDVISVDFSTGEIADETTGARFQATAFPEFITRIIEKGGLLPYLKARQEAQE